VADAVARSARSIEAIAALVGARVEAPEGFDLAAPIAALETVDRAGPEDLTFVGNARFARMLAESRARAAVVSESVEIPAEARGRAILRVASADLAMIEVLRLFAPPELLPPMGIDRTARVDPTAIIGEGARIGAFVTVGRGAVVGPRTALFDGARLYEDCIVGADCVFHSGVVVRERSRVGDRVILASGVVLGTDGFGYRPSADGRGIVKIPHVGFVEIGDDVEIGANTCVDRGKFGATRIGAGTKIDNLCQIGHNVEIGRCVVISGLVGIAGSTRIGDGVQIGGGSGVADHLVVGRGARLAARSAVMNDVPEGATWGGAPAQDLRATLREFAVIRKLPEWHRRLSHLIDPPTAP
jgi:UDP-3-O-[3-hydroxymyristoyl] glucosamine N-acyltransferase